MSETLTYDPGTDTVTTENNLTPDEQESLQVGEELQSQQENLLAGKYKDAQDLEKAYIELQKKLGDSEKPSEETTTTESEPEVAEAESGDSEVAPGDGYLETGEVNYEAVNETYGEQLGGLFSLLTVEFLVPYLNRTLLVLNRNNTLPKLPKDIVRPKIVAGVNALGRGQDREALTMFVTTVAQTLGAEALMKYINPSEAIKRLAASQGIDTLNLIKSEQQLQQEMQAAQQQQMQASLVDQAGQLAGTPMMDPSKNPDAKDQANRLAETMQGQAEQQPPQE